MHEIIRQQALDAAAHVIDDQIQNVLGKNLAWQAVGAALDAYEEEWAMWMYAGGGRTVYVLTLDAKPVTTMPTRRMARRHRKTLAGLSGRRLIDYRIHRAIAYTI